MIGEPTPTGKHVSEIGRGPEPQRRFAGAVVIDTTTTGTLCFVNGMPIYAGAEVWMLEAAEALRDRGWSVDFVVHPDGPLARAARERNFPVAEIAIRGDIAPWSIGAVWRRFRRSRPNAVICNRLKDLKVAGVAARLAGRADHPAQPRERRSLRGDRPSTAGT